MTQSMGVITSYAEAWDVVYGDEGMAHEAGSWFVETFPLGHQSSLKPFVEEVLKKDSASMRLSLQPEKEDGCEFHPEALALLLEHGKDYFPSLKMQNFFRFEVQQPMIGQCMGNSWRFMCAMNNGALPDEKMVYVEGMVYGFMTKPALHAWNAPGLTATHAIDWTHYIGCEFSRYLGIPFTEDEYERLRAKMYPDEPNHPVSLFDLKHFPLLREEILQILATREMLVM